MTFPFVFVPDLHLGPLPIHPFGVLVASAVLVGNALAMRRAERFGYDLLKLNSMISWMLLFGFVLSHVFDQLFYYPEQVLERPWALLFFWEGMSSFGGFLGAAVGIVLWKYFEAYEVGTCGPLPLLWVRRRVEPLPLLPFVDVILAVFPVAWVLGRAGCAVVHDHPGIAAAKGALFAVAYPTPSPAYRIPAGLEHSSFGPIQWVYGEFLRYDLGLLEMLLAVVMAVLFALIWRRRLPIGSYMVATALLYAPVRFCFDFLRTTEGVESDRRYAGLTFAQWGCIVLFVFGSVRLPFLFRKEILRLDLIRDPDAPEEGNLLFAHATHHEHRS